MLQFVTDFAKGTNSVTNNINLKKLTLYIVSAVASLVIFFAFGVCASAASYPSVQMDVPRISQRPGTGDCAIASMASVEAYMHHLPSGDYNSRAYQAVYSTNGYTISAYWGKLGYDRLGYFSMEEAYRQLSTGYPVIVFRSSYHFSVVYAYVGSTSHLEMSGFKVMDVDDSYNENTAYKRLDTWAGGYSVNDMVVRRNGIAITPASLSINCNHPPISMAKGEKFSPYGMVLSPYKITTVTVYVKDSAGKVVQTYTVNPSSTGYSLSSVSGKINTASLAAGNYTYVIYAADSSKATKTYRFNFSVGGGQGSGESQESTQPVVKTVNYKAVVTADPCLNMRKGASLGYDVITTIPYGEVVPVTAECDNWAKVTYKNYVGWVSKDYIKNYVEPVIAPVTPAPVIDNPTANTVYARVLTKSGLKKSASMFTTNVLTIPQNAIVQVVKTQNEWLKVMYNGKTGYVAAGVCVVNMFDIDGDKSINASDALVVLKYSVNMAKLTENQLKVGDADGDGKVNSSDALVILQISTGKKKYG